MSATSDGFFASARLPTVHGEFDLRVYKEGGLEHLLLSVGEIAEASNLLVRVHSECLTSEVLGSLKCDCKAQLDKAMSDVQAEGRGAILYLRQEGRGIGLGNKIKAYALQENGADTVDANRLLGFEDDLRNYDIAGEIFQAAGVRSVRLMTNNPDKISGLTRAGIKVLARVDCVAGLNTVNHHYMKTKQLRMGHLYDVDGSVPSGKKTAG